MWENKLSSDAPPSSAFGTFSRQREKGLTEVGANQDNAFVERSPRVYKALPALFPTIRFARCVDVVPDTAHRAMSASRAKVVIVRYGSVPLPVGIVDADAHSDIRSIRVREETAIVRCSAVFFVSS